MANEMNESMGKQEDFIPDDTAEELENPQNNQEVANGSMAATLRKNVGFYVVVEFLVGTNRLEVKEGILYSVGINFLTLYDPQHDRYIVCDLYAVKFVTFYNSTTVPPDRLDTQNNIPQNNRQQNTTVTSETASAATPVFADSHNAESITADSTNYPPSAMPFPPMRGNFRRSRW